MVEILRQLRGSLSPFVGFHISQVVQDFRHQQYYPPLFGGLLQRIPLQPITVSMGFMECVAHLFNFVALIPEVETGFTKKTKTFLL